MGGRECIPRILDILNKQYMINGFLHKNIHGEWIVIEGENYYYPHPDHTMWLKIFGKENMEVCFVIDDSNTAYYNIAILKACFPDTREYVQD